MQKIYKTRTEYVVDEIKERILSGQLVGGEPIRQGALAESLQVSRIPVREALAQLEIQGLVKLLPHRGAVVTEMSLDEIDELFSLRSMIEPYVLEAAIPHMDDTTFNEAARVLERLEEALDERKDISQWSNLNYEFHRCLYRPSGKGHSLDLITTLNLRSDRYVRIQLLYTDGIDQAEHEHRELLRLCQEHNISAATQLLKRHILGAGRATKALVKNQSPKVS